MTFVVVTPPTVEPVTLAEVKAHCRVSGSASDDELNAFIVSARMQAEQELRRYLITQTIDAYYDSFPNFFELPPLQSVTSITYLDDNGDSQVLATSQYRVDAVSTPARITPAYGVSWPSTYGVTNAVTVRFIAGYGDYSSVPQCIKQWIKLQVSNAYDNRTPVTIGGSMSTMPNQFVGGLLDPERVTSRL